MNEPLQDRELAEVLATIDALGECVHVFDADHDQSASIEAKGRVMPVADGLLPQDAQAICVATNTFVRLLKVARTARAYIEAHPAGPCTNEWYQLMEALSALPSDVGGV